MPDSLPDTEAVQPSTPTTETTSQTTTNSDAPAGTSSTPEKPTETLLDRVRSVLKKPEDSSASENSGSPAIADPAKSPAETPDGEGLPADEAKSLHPKTKVRFEKLTSELKAKGKELDALKPKAAEYDKIETFIRNAGLTHENVSNILQIGAMLRSDPQSARDRLRPIMAELDRMLGETLPPELQARVDQGYLTLEDAKALSRSAADATLSKKQRDTALDARRQDDAVQNQKQQTNATLDAVDTWEKQKAKGDPDWHQKQAEVSELVELAINRKSLELQKPWFPSPTEAVQMSEDALKTVNERYKRFSPKPRAIDPPVTAGASPRSTPAPKSTMDIIRNATARAA